MMMIVYAVTSGNAKPAKHHLGLVLKSLTGSKCDVVFKH